MPSAIHVEISIAVRSRTSRRGPGEKRRRAGLLFPSIIEEDEVVVQAFGGEVLAWL